MRSGSNLALEGTETVVKLTLATATGDAEVEGEEPLVCDAGEVDGRNDGSFCVTLETLETVLCVLHAVHRSCGEGSKIGSGGTSLIGTLKVKTHVPTFAHETDTGRVEIGGIHVEVGVARRVTKERNTLVGVGQITSGESGRHRADRGSSHKDDFSHISFLLVKTSAKVRLSCTQAKQIVQ